MRADTYALHVVRARLADDVTHRQKVHDEAGRVLGTYEARLAIARAGHEAAEHLLHTAEATLRDFDATHPEIAATHPEIARGFTGEEG